MLTEFFSKFAFPIAEKSLNRAIRDKFLNLKSEMEKPYEARKKRQLIQLRDQLKIAQTKVPYYKDLFKKIKFDPDSVLLDEKYLLDIPYLTKDILRDELPRFINIDYELSSLIMRETNGSTGATIPIYYNLESLDWSSAVNAYTNYLVGKPMYKSEVYVTPVDLIKNKLQDRVAEIAKCAVLNRRNVNYRTLSDDDLDRILRDLKSTNPELILGTPSTFNALAKYVKRNPRMKVALNTLVSTGELLDDQKKTEIEHYLKCRVYNRFGNAEVGIFAHDTPTENLKIIDYIAYIETMSLERSNASEIVLTNLKNSVMPLIRYRTGDLGELYRNSTGEYLANVQGRVHEILYLNGESIHTNLIKEMLFKIGNIDDFQIHKCKEKGYLLKLVAEEKSRELIKESIKNVWGKTFEIQFTSQEQLSKVGLRKKFQYFIDNSAS